MHASVRSMRSMGGRVMSRPAVVFASCSLGILFLFGFPGFEPACLAQSSVEPDQPSQQGPAAYSKERFTIPVPTDEEANRCLESTCRDAPVREKLTAIPLGTKYVRGIIGGFEQGAGIGGGVQLSSADRIPSLELRGTALTSSRFYRRFDLEGYLPNIHGSRNHADMWFSYMRRESDFFGIGPRISQDLKTAFANERESVGCFPIWRLRPANAGRRCDAGNVSDGTGDDSSRELGEVQYLLPGCMAWPQLNVWASGKSRLAKGSRPA